jgi:PAS domain S-box-containing protein
MMETDKKETVLIVDDEPANLSVLFEYLRQANFRVLAAEDGNSALMGLSHVIPDIALLDVKLPDMDGFELYRHLKERCRNIPVIFLTSLTDIQDRLKGLDLDAADYITKPFYPEEVVARVKKHLMIRNLQKSLEEKNIQLEREIAERRKTEQVLRESEERFRQMFFQHSAVMLVIDPDNGNIIMANQAAEQYYGFTASEFKRLTIFRINMLGLSEIKQEMINACNNRSNHFIFQHRLADGRIRDVEVHSTPIYLHGQPMLFSVIHDITERKQAEKSLLEKERLLSDIINFLPDATFVIDTQGKVLAWNRAMETMTGIKAADMLGKGDYEYAIPFYGEPRPILIDLALNSVSDVEKIYDQIHRTGDNLFAEHYYPNLWGREIWLFGTACVLRNSEGEIVGAIESVRDITEMKKAHRSLQEEKQNAESASRAKSAFLANMSHELRTPLNGILGYAQILKHDSGLTKQQQDGLNIIEKNGNRLLSLLNDILDIVKIESGKVELHESDFHFPDFIQSLCASVRVRAESKGIRFISEIPPESDKMRVPASIRADEKRLRQILMNLLDNAVKFTDQGSVTLRIRAKSPDVRAASPARRISFEIEDTGTGISDKELGKIFDPFYQSGYKKYRAEGTGLGLSLTRTLIEMMGGKLRVRSRTGSGSTFSFELMLAEVIKEKENQGTEPKIVGIRKNLPAAEILETLGTLAAGDAEGIRNLLPALKQAAADGDSEKLYRTIADIREHDAALAEELNRLADDFAFDTILDVIQKYLQAD